MPPRRDGGQAKGGGPERPSAGSRRLPGPRFLPPTSPARAGEWASHSVATPKPVTRTCFEEPLPTVERALASGPPPAPTPFFLPARAERIPDGRAGGAARVAPLPGLGGYWAGDVAGRARYQAKGRGRVCRGLSTRLGALGRCGISRSV